PARTHGGHGFKYPVDQGVGGVEHDKLGFVFRATALGRHLNVNGVTGHQFNIDDAGRIVTRVFTCEQRVGQHRGTQGVVRVQVTTAHTLIAQFLHGTLRVDTNVHADLEEHIDNAG